ncbi:MAG: glutamate--tRNA ligase [Rhodospirillaceae bacterium]|nr:glutamate--tRNA ligase [Rhodospirillaceae bacterium]|tara:strand:- start:529 stop:1950 length:1422 start_codon:yes stop_codon:yes gene_type:complete
MTVVTRFAPSPTGYLHIGGARTALFNYLFARKHGGKYLIRIEDTDRKRSTESAITAIFQSLEWLNLMGDEAPIFQHSRLDRHKTVVKELLTTGKAYRCYCSPEELDQMRVLALKQGKTALYDGKWRDRDPADAPPGSKPVIRLKTSLEGKTEINDLVQGSVSIQNAMIDDFVLLRADGTPTYMLSVVVDDHDMQITHVIRGDDHLNNAFRQFQLFEALNWNIPDFAHIPLIHGPDGAKLSKRHGTLGAETYREMGYLPEALCNYLLRLGWGHGDEEFISRNQAIEWFDLGAVGRSPSRLDEKKLDHLNAEYIRTTSNSTLFEAILPTLAQQPGVNINNTTKERIKQGIVGLKPRIKNTKELAEKAVFYAASVPLSMDEKALEILHDGARQLLNGLLEPLYNLKNWTETDIEETIKAYAEGQGVKLGAVAQPLRAALTGTVSSPGIFEVSKILGRQEVVLRINSVCGKVNGAVE